MCLRMVKEEMDLVCAHNLNTAFYITINIIIMEDFV